MKKIVVLFFLLLLQDILFAKNLTLTVEVEGLKNKNGDLIVALYNKEGTIPDEKLNKFFKKKTISMDELSKDIKFENLSEGRYAVIVIHDENKNGKIDKGLLLPKEGVGFSNFSSISIINKPNFKKASFILDKDLTKKIKLIYF